MYVGLQLNTVWNKIIECIKIEPKYILELLRFDYETRLREKWGESIFRNIIETQDFAYPSDENITQKSQRRGLRLGIVKEWTISPCRISESGKRVLITQSSLKNATRTRIPTPAKKDALNEELSLESLYEDYYKGCHLFVLVHRFQGTQADMKFLKNQISLVHPEGVYLLSKSNEKNTEGDLAEMGGRLAKEVSDFIDQYCPGSSLGRLSFIVPSMGGLISRAAFPHLEKYKDIMYTFILLSSPHLGYMYNSSKLIGAGMWFLKKGKGAKSLT